MASGDWGIQVAKALNIPAVAAIASGLILCCAALHGQVQDKPVGPEHPDAGFIRLSARVHLLEIELSDLAPQRSDSADVKRLALRIGEQRRRSRAALELLATHLKIPVAASLTELARQKVATLAAQSGVDSTSAMRVTSRRPMTNTFSASGIRRATPRTPTRAPSLPRSCHILKRT